VAQRLEQLLNRESRIENERNIEISGYAIDQASDERRFAGTDLTSDEHETTVCGESVHQVRQRFAVAFAQVQEARIGSDREGLLFEPEVVIVHVQLSGRRARDSRALTVQRSEPSVLRRPNLVNPMAQLIATFL